MVLKSRVRDQLAIIAEILVVAKDGSLKTQIMYRASLSFRQLITYLQLLLQRELLKKITENGKTIYKTTANGMKYLECYRTLTELLSPETRAELDQKQASPIHGR